MTTTRERVKSGERVLSLSEAAERLRMKRSNTGKFLARHGIEPAFPKAQGYFYWESDIERLVRARERDAAKLAADERRRATAIRRARGEPEIPTPPPVQETRMGETQRAVMSEILRRPVEITNENRFAIRRLRARGLVEDVPGAAKHVQATTLGREAAARL